jgi:hypothetical protein
MSKGRPRGQLARKEILIIPTGHKAHKRNHTAGLED